MDKSAAVLEGVKVWLQDRAHRVVNVEEVRAVIARLENENDDR